MSDTPLESEWNSAIAAAAEVCQIAERAHPLPHMGEGFYQLRGKTWLECRGRCVAAEKGVVMWQHLIVECRHAEMREETGKAQERGFELVAAQWLGESPCPLPDSEAGWVLFFKKAKP